MSVGVVERPLQLRVGAVDQRDWRWRLASTHEVLRARHAIQLRGGKALLNNLARQARACETIMKWQAGGKLRSVVAKRDTASSVRASSSGATTCTRHRGFKGGG